ncbi:hypothetical protein C5167_048006 [Papaver somniferum]|uniref:FBD domain-containing protein n=1 Tax=Papaver somniferum TaxID=3469 RepID=A0A4Y7KI33_PAPSO|nr:uncharacterized protein LOC113302332 [Papaver somniferum]RZC72526.1 hypothetical protein C5167_048006 [Papaver somniferum]
MILENIKDENAETYSKLPLGEKEVHAKRVMKFLKAVYMVREMRLLSPGFLEVLSGAPDLVDCQPPRLCSLKYLTLAMWSTRGCIRAIVYLLSISPNITKVFLKAKESCLADVGDEWETGLSFPGMLSHLEYVQIEVEGCDAELKFLCFLLKRAKVLKKVVLYFRSSVGSPDHGVTQVEQFMDTLRLVPTASSCIQVVFKT